MDVFMYLQQKEIFQSTQIKPNNGLKEWRNNNNGKGMRLEFFAHFEMHKVQSYEHKQ